MPHPDSHITPYPRADWDQAYRICDEQGWEPVPEDEPEDEPATDLIPALTAAYQAQKQDRDAVRATILAAAERHGVAWSAADFTEVATSFTVRLRDGWEQLARDYLDDHYPDFPVQWLRHLDEIGQEVARPSEQYVVLDGELFIFTRP